MPNLLEGSGKGSHLYVTPVEVFVIRIEIYDQRKWYLITWSFTSQTLDHSIYTGSKEITFTYPRSRWPPLNPWSVWSVANTSKGDTQMTTSCLETQVFVFLTLYKDFSYKSRRGYLVQELLHKSMCGWLMQYLVSIPAGCCSRATTGSDWPGERTCHEWKLGPTGGGTEENRWREGRWGEDTCVGRRGRREVGRVKGRRGRERGRAGSCDKV